MNKKTLTAIILAKNEEQMLANCLETLKWVDKIIVVNDGSTDNTVEIAENFGAQVIHFEHSSFAKLRNQPLKQVETDWVMYIDPDERVTPTLAKEILVHIETGDHQAFILKRSNICYGHKFEHGGWENDEVTRVFQKKSLKEWQGKVHESPVYEGKTFTLATPLIHLTHRNTQDNLRKSAEWTKIEAELLAKADISTVNFFTLLRKGSMEFLRRAVFKKGYKDGLPGLIEALVQAMNKIMIYIQVWELQQNPSLEDQYRQQEIQIVKKWQQADVKHLIDK